MAAIKQLFFISMHRGILYMKRFPLLKESVNGEAKDTTGNGDSGWNYGIPLW